jgi:putative SOS response-associated peptidase YedK
MPVILEPAQFEPWLTGAVGLDILKPAADDVLQCWSVSPQVNATRAAIRDMIRIRHPIIAVMMSIEPIRVAAG